MPLCDDHISFLSVFQRFKSISFHATWNLFVSYNAGKAKTNTDKAISESTDSIGSSIFKLLLLKLRFKYGVAFLLAYLSTGNWTDTIPEIQ